MPPPVMVTNSESGHIRFQPKGREPFDFVCYAMRVHNLLLKNSTIPLFSNDPDTS